MALADDPKDMILRMFHLQSREGFAPLCEAFPDGRGGSVFGSTDLVFGVFRERFSFSQSGVSQSGGAALPWTDVVRSSVAYAGGKDILTIEGSDGTRIRIDLSHPDRKRPAYRLQQLVDGLVRRWSEQAYVGLPAMDLEVFFAKARLPGSFAVNAHPLEAPSFYRDAFTALLTHDGVHDLKILPGDPEDEGPVYSQEIVVVSGQPEAFFADFMRATRGSHIVPINENDRKRSGLAGDVSAWVIGWT